MGGGGEGGVSMQEGCCSKVRGEGGGGERASPRYVSVPERSRSPGDSLQPPRPEHELTFCPAGKKLHAFFNSPFHLSDVFNEPRLRSRAGDSQHQFWDQNGP